METPSSSRRLTRSQTRSALSNSTQNAPFSKNGEETEKTTTKSRPKSALIDITNDSPIVGLAGKSIFPKTPLSAVSKQRRNVPKSTPGSGEALLRGQVKTLLQKVEEEAEISRFLGSIRPQFRSPMAILAPTPANTPQVSGGGEQTVVDDFAVEFPIHDQFKVSQIVSDLFDVKMIVSDESEKDLITRSLLMDFSEKSDSSAEEKSSASLSECSSVVTYESSKEKSAEDAEEEDVEEDASVWSIQVNASIRDEEEDEEEDIVAVVEEVDEEVYDDEEEEECEDGFMDELCAGMGKMSVGEIRFEGKHTRFVYNSVGEIEKEEEVVHLKGLPSPKGKHLRFAEEEEEEE